MPDLATLGLVIDKNQVVAADASLEKMGATGEAAGARVKRAFTGTDPLMQRLGQEARNTSTFIQQLSNASAATGTQIQKMEQSINNARTGTGRLENAITNLGVGLTGLNPQIGNVADKLGGFAIGGVYTAAFAIGIGSIIGLLKKLGEQAEDTAAKVLKAADSVKFLRETDAAATQRRIAELKALRTALEEEQRAALASGGAPGSGVAERVRGAVNRFFADQRSPAEIAKELQALNRELVPLEANLIKINEASVTKELDDQTKAWTKFGNNLVQQTETIAEAIQRNVPWLLQGRSAGGFTPNGLGEPPGFTTEPYNPLSTPTILLGAAQREHLFRKPAEDSVKVAESWRSASQSVANIVTLLANADSATAQWLGNVVSLVGQIEDAAKELKDVGKLSITSTVGLFAGFASTFLGGLASGKSQAQREFEAAQQKNTEAIERLRGSLNTLNAGLTGNQFSRGQAGVSALLGSNLGGLGFSFQNAQGYVNQILAGAGSSLTELKDLAKTLGITLATDTIPRFLDSLHQMDEALKQIALVRLKDFAGQLDLINRQWALGGVTDPLKKLADLLKLASGEQGSPTLGLLGQFDLSQGAGRTAALNFLQQQLARAQNGNLTTAELGGLTVQQYLDFLSQFGALLNEANQQLQQTVDNLKNFADSLKLDQLLTTLSPAQQLAEARRQYEDVLRAAQLGDQAAANRLPDVARQFLTASRAYNASSPAYAADFARVLADTDAVAKLLQGQENGWKVIEKPLVNVQDNTEKAVERLETLIEVQRVGLQETVDKLDAIRSEMAASVLATKVGFEGGKQ